MDLASPLNILGKTYTLYAKRFESLGVRTVADLLYYIPYRYEDYSLITPIRTLQEGEIVTVIGTVTEIKTSYIRTAKNLQKAVVDDGTGSIDIVWFNQPYLTKMIRAGDKIAIAGKVGKSARKLQFTAPEYELLSHPDTPQIHTGRLVPIYHETKGISSKYLRRQVYKILQEMKGSFTEHFPQSIIKSANLMGIMSAIEQIHFPATKAHAIMAKKRLAFEELFFSQLYALQRRTDWQKHLQGQPFIMTNHTKTLENFIQSLPFHLTNAQEKTLDHIFTDLQKEKPMNRLVEGDVGSGKTIIAAIAMYTAFLNGKQSVFMAPTEILAQQHFQTIEKFLSPFGLTITLVTGSKKQNKEKKTDILVGTHAVLSNNIQFDNLGLVIVDEQQRFGVAQRSIIRSKGANPHFLTMTATPIPRTIALTMYGDLDLSVIDEMPLGRKIIKTWLTPDEKRANAYSWIRRQILETKCQAFIICPFIEESESMQTVKAAAKEYETLVTKIFPDLKLGLLHGKMKAKEKDIVLEQFREKQFDILVATPVVEVGIDIPNATIIVIEAAERFGLSQLHQLRGRVGRGDKQSYCLLFTESTNQKTIDRLKGMERMHIGMDLADFDLQLRGPGDIFGTQQHGLPFFKVASFADLSLIESAKQEAEKIFSFLNSYPLIQMKLIEYTKDSVSPD